MGVFAYKPGRHTILDKLPMVQWARAEFGEDVFVFFHAQSQNYCWGCWAMPGQIEQLMVIGPDINCFDRAQAARLREVLCGTPADLKGELAAWERAEARREDDAVRQENEALARIGRDLGGTGHQDHPAFRPGGIDRVWGNPELAGKV